MLSVYNFKMKKNNYLYIYSDDIDVEKWAGMPLWTLEEFSALLLGVNPDVDQTNTKPDHVMDVCHGNGYHAYCTGREEQTKYLHRQIILGKLHAKTDGKTYFVTPSDCVEYCQFNEIDIDADLKMAIKNIQANLSDVLPPLISEGNGINIDKLLEMGIIAGMFCGTQECEITKQLLDSELARYGYRNTSETLLLKIYKLLPDDVKAKGRPKGILENLIRATFFIADACGEGAVDIGKMIKLANDSGTKLNKCLIEKIYNEYNGINAR